jgi:SOS-response transcriptional repressor LexA
MGTSMGCKRHHREEAILRVLEQVGDRHGLSLDDLAWRVAAPRTTTYGDLQQLLDAGDVEADAPVDGRPRKYRPTRHYRLTANGAARIGVSSTPVFEIAAGRPKIVIDPYPGDQPTLKDVLGLRPGYFALKVDGWSMREEGIQPGDVLLIDPQPPELIKMGDVVVVAVHDEGTDVAALTLKRWHPEAGGRVRLQPAHVDVEDPDAEPAQPFYQDRAEVEICGRLVGVICPTGRRWGGLAVL